MNTIAKIREKLDIYGKSYIDSIFLKKILSKFAPNYTISQLCDQGLLTPIKRGKSYLNNKTRDFINPYIVGSLYFKENIYAFGGLAVYNKYGLSTQVPEWYTIYNTKISGKKVIGNSKFIFVRQREGFFYGINSLKVGDYDVKILSPERSFIQLLKENKDSINEIPYGINGKKLLMLAENSASKNIIKKIKELCL